MNSKIQERILLTKLELIADPPSPIKRKAKIFTNRLPQDFFSPINTPNLAKRNQIHTQNFSRRIPSLQRQSETRDMQLRGGNLSLSWKDQQDKAMDLIKGVIKTSRQIKKIIRKHSLQLRKENNSQIESYRVELPPIIVKKGVAYPL